MEEEKKELVGLDQQEEKAPDMVVEAQEGESNEGYSFPWPALIVFGVLVVIIVACIIVICETGGPIE